MTQPVTAARLQDEILEDVLYSVLVILDGGFGWVVVASAFVTTFCHNGWYVLATNIGIATLTNIFSVSLVSLTWNNEVVRTLAVPDPFSTHSHETRS